MLDIEETIQIHFNSRYANNYVNGSISNCEFFLPLIEIPPQHHIHISIVSASIPYTFYNLDSSNNYIQYFITDNNAVTTLYDFYITEGNYNVYQLLAYLKTKLGTDFTITYDIITNKFTFIHSTYIFGFVGNTSTALEFLGFKKTAINYDITTYVSINRILISYYCINVQSKHCLCVGINYPTGNINYSNKLTNNILVSIPITGNPYSMIVYDNPNSYKANLYTDNLSYMNIKIVDQNNSIINLNGCHWTITMQLDIVRFVE